MTKLKTINNSRNTTQTKRNKQTHVAYSAHVYSAHVPGWLKKGRGEAGRWDRRGAGGLLWLIITIVIISIITMLIIIIIIFIFTIVIIMLIVIIISMMNYHHYHND